LAHKIQNIITDFNRSGKGKNTVLKRNDLLLRLFYFKIKIEKSIVTFINFMKGVILAGGTGSRLYPCTKVTNKHLLPVYNKPMIFYPIETLKGSGVNEILVISSPEHAGDFMQLLGSGADINVNFTYKIQDGAGGIAQALSLAEDFANGESLAVILSDNIFEEAFPDDVMRFKQGAQIFVKEVEDPGRFGVVELKEDNTVRSIEEKPSFPKSKLAQTGLYLYDNQVFSYIKQVQPSKRGELEITDVNNLYREKNLLKARKFLGMWADAGTHDSLLEANILAHEAFSGISLRRELKSETPMLNAVSPKVTIGLLTCNSEAYLEPCLDSLLAQDYENLEIVVLDNHSQDNSAAVISENYPEIELLESEENLGFGKGHNRIINQTYGEFYACLNADMIFEPNFISALVRAVSEKPIYGSAGGKLKRWDFKGYRDNSGDVREMGKTNFIDSVGIRMLKNHRFEDLGQGEVDYGQYDETKDLFGISGAAVLYRRKALEDVAFTNQEGEKEYFDEAMFMYKEDIDLAYRMQWAAWKCRYTPNAIAYHDRTVTTLGSSTWEIIKHRNSKPSRINQMSYLNHKILVQKNFVDDFSLGVKSSTGWYNFKMFMYLALFEQETLTQWWKLFKLRKKIRAQRETMPRRVSQAEIEKLMEA